MDSGISNWDIIAIIGTISFALQGGIIAMEEEYDLFAVYLFGMLTSFGGGGTAKYYFRWLRRKIMESRVAFFCSIYFYNGCFIFPYSNNKKQNIFYQFFRFIWDNGFCY